MDDAQIMCMNCTFCKVLYVPPASCFDKVTEACGGMQNSYVCTVFEEEYGSVQYLGSWNGRCEMFTDKGVSK